MVVLGIAVAGAAAVVAIQLTSGDHFPGSETVTRSGLDAVADAPVCHLGSTPAGCVIAHHPGSWGFPLEAGGLAIVMDADGGAVAFDGDAIRWQFPEGQGRPEDRGLFPVHWANDFLIFGVPGHDEGDTNYVALSVSDGHVAWRGEFDVAGGLGTVFGDVLVVGVEYYGDVPASPVVGVDRTTGKILWRTEPLWRFPSLGREGPLTHAYETDEGRTVCLDITSGALDSTSDPGECPVDTTYPLGGLREIIASNGETWSLPPDELAAGFTDALVVTFGSEGDPTVRLRSRDDGAVLWSARSPIHPPSVGDRFSSLNAEIGDRRVLFSQRLSQGDPLTLAVHSRQNGELLWGREEDVEASDSERFPRLVGDRVYLFGPSEVTVFGDNGDVRWGFPGPATTAIHAGERVLLIGPDDVWVIDPPR